MKAYVFFHSANGTPWWAKFCDKEFTHCFMITEQILYDIPIYIRLESLTRVILNDVSLTDIDTTINTVRACKGKVRVLVGEIPTEQPDSFCQLVHLNCASIVKKTLAINRPVIFTPKQLYKHLKTIGFKEA